MENTVCLTVSTVDTRHMEGGAGTKGKQRVPIMKYHTLVFHKICLQTYNNAGTTCFGFFLLQLDKARRRSQAIVTTVHEYVTMA